MIKIAKRGSFLLLGIVFFMNSVEYSFAQDSTKNDSLKNNFQAIEIFKSHLAIVDTVSSLELLAKNESIMVSDIEETLNFLERVTQIPSTAEYTYAGRFKVPRKDYDKWKEWFKNNKQCLKWDAKKQKVMFLKN